MVKIAYKFKRTVIPIVYRVTNFSSVRYQPWSDFKTAKRRLRAIEKMHRNCVIERKIVDGYTGEVVKHVLHKRKWIYWLDFMRKTGGKS